jgi:hypothetical protein
MTSDRQKGDCGMEKDLFVEKTNKITFGHFHPFLGDFYGNTTKFWVEKGSIAATTEIKEVI